MPGTVLWFVLVLVAVIAAWYAGQSTTHIRDRWRRGCVIGTAMLFLIGWAALIHHPAIAVQIIPLPVLARLEGVGAAPLFVFMLGVGWRHAQQIRQRAVMVLGMCLGLAYFVQGGMWMMRPTPTSAFGFQSDQLLVWQTQDYSCVPAASATALRMLGIRAEEMEMAQLTETKVGSGATLLRAMNGISKRLKYTGIQARLLEPDYEELMRLEPPVLTPLQYEAARLHMVTIVDVRPQLVMVADPQSGVEFISRHRFLELYRGKAIAFEGQADRSSVQDMLTQNKYVQDPDALVAN